MDVQVRLGRLPIFHFLAYLYRRETPGYPFIDVCAYSYFKTMLCR